MSHRFHCDLILGILLAGSLAAIGPAQPRNGAKSTEDIHADVFARLNTVIDTRQLQKEQPLADFLKQLAQLLPKDAKLAVRFDAEPFGNDAAKILAAKVQLPAVPARMTASLALRLALAQTAAADRQVEFSARPGEILITTLERSLHTANYDVRSLLKDVPFLHQTFVEINQLHGRERDEFLGPGIPFDERADPKKPADWLARQIMHGTDPSHAVWHQVSKLQIVNSAKLIVHAPPSVHEEIVSLLHVMRRLADLGIVMNAQLYELERATYDKLAAPQFVDPKDKTKTRSVAKMTIPLGEYLAKRKPVVQGVADPLRPYQRADFLSLRNAYQYRAQPADTRLTAAFEGVAFAVRPIVSPDRRCIRLELFEEVEQLVRITRGTMLDLKTNKEMPIDLPNWRKSKLSATIDIEDGQPIVMAVTYRPEDKVWLLAAQPRIYMEEEEELIRKQSMPRMPLADEKPAPPEPAPVEEKVPPEPPAVVLPDNDDVQQILKAVVENILTDPDFKLRDLYGTNGDKKFALDNDAQIRWPKNFAATIAGHTQHQFEPGECRSFQPRVLGLRLDGFGWDGKKANVKEVSIDVVVHNVGGNINGLSPGRGCHVLYTARRDGKRWVVQCEMVNSP